MMIKRAAWLAFTAACLTGIATLPAAHAQMANSPPGGDAGGNSMGLYGPNPGGPGLTPYSGGAPGATQPYPGYPSAPGTYGATQPYPDYPAPSAAGTGNAEMATYSQQPPGWSPEQNVRQSERYTWLLQHNRAFREARMRRECGPITDPQLHQNCLASFAEYSPWAGSAPAYGSSSSSRSYSSRSGR